MPGLLRVSRRGREAECGKVIERSRQLSILYVAYPLLTVSEESAGGAEQMLFALEHEVSAAGHWTIVAASRGSRVSGELLATGLPASHPDQYESREAEQVARVLAYLGENPGKVDLIHDESGSFWRHARKCCVPMLATLHLPRSFYREEWFRDLPPNLFFNCVSESQARTFDNLPNLLGVVQNGIPLERFSFQDTALVRAQNSRDCNPARNQSGDASSKYVLWLGRICEEKGPHLAIAAARHADIPIVIAGQVYPFRYHQDYFEREIKPYLSGSADGEVRFVEGPHFNDKLELLRKARAVLLTSTAEETSSLVAVEAMACGTPVVAFRQGAFPEIVADGVTGFVVDTIEEMAAALRRVDQISPERCRQRVKEHFTAERMRREYEALYRQVLREAGEQAVA